MLAIIGLTWMSLIHVVLLLVLVPVSAVVPGFSLWLVYSSGKACARAPLTRRMLLPLAVSGVTIVWASLFIQPSNGEWNGWRWPAYVAFVLYIVAVVAAIEVWLRSGRDRRVGGLLLLQLFVGLVTAWVAAAAVSPGSGLGAL